MISMLIMIPFRKIMTVFYMAINCYSRNSYMLCDDVCNVTTFSLYFIVLNDRVVNDKIGFSSFSIC